MPAMDDMMGDDFGDLYADFVVSETSAIASNFINLYAEPQPQEKEDDTGSNCNGNHKVKSCLDGEKQLSNGGLRDSEADGSDSEDDLNIVLNDDGPLARNGNKFNNEGGYEEEDDGEDGVSVGNGSGKNVSDPSVDRNDVKISASAYNSSNSAHVNKHGRHYGSSYQINNMANESVEAPSLIRPSMDSLVSYGGYGFSIPRYRTILDVNIDAFQEKRWRYPGVDITDFFNFGFNEDTWKLYCITLEQLRPQSYMNSGGAFHEPSNITQRERVMQEAVAGNTTAQVGSSSKSSDMGDEHVGLIKGRAIQVEDSSGERLATMDLQCPRSWDSDDVIEINIQDTNETSSVSEKEEGAHINATSPQASKCTDLNMDDKRYVHSSASASGGEQSGESIEGNIRYSKPALGCKESSMDSDNLENGWISDADGHLQQNMKAQTSKDVTEAREIAEKGEAEICNSEYKLHQHTIESESSLGDQSHFSLALSCFESDAEASTDGVDVTPKGCPCSSPCSSRRQLPGTDLTETVAPDHKSPKKNGALRKPGVSQNSSSYKSHILEGRKHQTRGHRRLSGQKSCFYERYNGPPVHRYRSPVDCIGRIEKLHDFDYRKGEDFSYYEQKGFSSDYGSEKIADNRIEAACNKHSRREFHKRYRDDLRLWESRNWNEREYLREKGIGCDYQDDRDREWYICRRVLSPEDRIPTYGESRPLVSNYDDSKQRDNRWRSKSDTISYGESTVHDSYCLDHQNGGPRKYGRSISFASWKGETLDGRCERKNSFIVREVNYSGKRVRCCDGDCPSLDLDSSSYIGMEDGHWNPEHEHLSHRSKRRQDMVLPRIGDSFYSRSTERYGRCRRQVYESDRRKNVRVYPDGVSSYHDKENMCYDIIYPDDQVNLGRRKFCAEHVMLSEARDELVLSHQDDRFYAERKSGYHGKSSNNEGLHAKFRFPGCGTTFDDMWQKKHRYKAIGQGGSSNNVTRISKMIYRGEDETARSGKSSGNLMRNVNLEKMDVRRFAKEHATKNGLSESRTGKAAQIFEGNHGDDKWVDKFPVKKQNKDSDFEEGELITEEVNIKNKLGVKRNSEGGSSTCHVQKRISDSENSSNGNQSSSREYDDQWIRDSMAKMEKRRERFKDPIAAKMEADKSSKSQVDTIETKAERPSRKRRWCGS